MIFFFNFKTSQEEWRVVFWIVLGVFVVTNAVFVVWASGDEQWWNDIKKHGYPENWKHAKKEKTNDEIEVGKDNNAYQKDETSVTSVSEEQL